MSHRTRSHHKRDPKWAELPPGHPVPPGIERYPDFNTAPKSEVDAFLAAFSARKDVLTEQNLRTLATRYGISREEVVRRLWSDRHRLLAKNP